MELPSLLHEFSYSEKHTANQTLMCDMCFVWFYLIVINIYYCDERVRWFQRAPAGVSRPHSNQPAVRGRFRRQRREQQKKKLFFFFADGFISPLMDKC